jgi:S-adenosylmethionine:tRNA ribosyltransferase-isomerase
MKLKDFDYDLPEEFIAQEPVEPRDASRLMALNRTDESIHHLRFRDITDLIDPGDVLVMNTTRVIPARLEGRRADTGGRLEVLLLRQLSELRWQVLIGGKRAQTGTAITFPNRDDLTAKVVQVLDGAKRIVEFSQPVNTLLGGLGKLPLPPYIHTRLDDGERYQTVYSRQEGSAAAPTAGLHFTPELLLALRDRGTQFAHCVLHIGLDTFQPVRAEEIARHEIHSEWAQLSPEDAHTINQAKLSGHRVIAVGTTTARTLETAALLSAGDDPAQPSDIGEMCPWRPVTAFAADTRLFIYPGYRWRAVDALITNFHLPKSTLLMMIAAFAGREFILRAYEVAKDQGYRFFSFGDAMFIT